MATQDYAASIQGVAIRVTRLDANGNLLNGPGDSYTTTAFMSVTFTPEYEAGDEITQKSASGQVCVTYQAPDTMKRVTLEVAICEPDAELTSLIAGGLLLRKNLGSAVDPNNKSVGWAAPAVGDDPSGNGVAIEAWSLAIKDGKRAGTLPYFHWVFPYAKLSQSGDRVIENGLLATTFSGYGIGNSSFNTGLDQRWEFPQATNRPYSYARTTWAPAGLNGFYTWHGVLPATITAFGITGEVATVTTTAAHNFEPGERVSLTGTGNANLDGKTFTITATPSATTFRFSAPGVADVAQANHTGAATVPAGARSVEDLTTDVDTTFNVPGSSTFDPDLPIDVILDSIDTPTT